MPEIHCINNDSAVVWTSQNISNVVQLQPHIWCRIHSTQIHPWHPSIQAPQSRICIMWPVESSICIHIMRSWSIQDGMPLHPSIHIRPKINSMCHLVQSWWNVADHNWSPNVSNEVHRCPHKMFSKLSTPACIGLPRLCHSPPNPPHPCSWRPTPEMRTATHQQVQIQAPWWCKWLQMAGALEPKTDLHTHSWCAENAQLACVSLVSATCLDGYRWITSSGPWRIMIYHEYISPCQYPSGACTEMLSWSPSKLAMARCWRWLKMPWRLGWSGLDAIWG